MGVGVVDVLVVWLMCWWCDQKKASEESIRARSAGTFGKLRHDVHLCYAIVVSLINQSSLFPSLYHNNASFYCYRYNNNF